MSLPDFGSLNPEHCYQLAHPLREALASCNDRRSCGGKGFNQALVLFSAGQQVFTARAMDRDGLALKEMLEQSGVEASRVQLSDEPTGHAIIHADKQSGNSIILYGGAKQKKIHECFINLRVVIPFACISITLMSFCLFYHLRLEGCFPFLLHFDLHAAIARCDPLTFMPVPGIIAGGSLVFSHSQALIHFFSHHFLDYPPRQGTLQTQTGIP